MSPAADSQQRWLDDAPCAFLVTTVDGQLTWTNDTFARWLGRDVADTRGRSFHDLLTPAGSIVFETVTPSFALNARVRDIALDVRRSDGEVLNLLFNATVSVGPDDEIEVWWVGLDMTERRRYEQDLLVAQRRLRRLQDLSTALVAAATDKAVGEALLAALVDGVKADEGVVYVRADGPVDTWVVARRSMDANVSRLGDVVAVEGLVDEAIAGGEMVVGRFDSTDSDAARRTVARPVHVVSLPLKGEDRVLGVAVFALERHRPHSADEQQLLRSAVDVSAQALERVQLMTSLRRSSKRNRAASTLLHRMEETTTLSGRARIVVDFLVPAYADFATVEMPSVGPSPVALGHRDPSLEATLGWLRTNADVAEDVPHSLASGRAAREPTVLNAIDEAMYARYDDDEEHLAALRRLGPTAYLGLPLIAHGQPIGSLLLAMSDSGRSYSDTDVEYLSRVADTCALALENARLYEHERGMASQLQLALLPQGLPTDPRVHLGHHYEAGYGMRNVGGDWYDAFAVDADRLGLVVGDVVGGGLGAATCMAELRIALRSYALEGRGVVDVLDRLNRFASTVDGAYASSVVYAELDMERMRLTYSCAGHLPPVLVQPGRAPHVLWDGRRTLLAIEHTSAPAACVEVRPGSSIVLYTDGLVERRGRNLDDGLDALVAALAREPDLARSPAELAREVRAEDHDDDLCVLTVTRVGGD